MASETETLGRKGVAQAASPTALDKLAGGLRALGDGIEQPDAFEHIAKEIEPYGPRMAGRK